MDQLAAAVQADQAAIDSAQVQLNYATITAPIDGVTGIRQVDTGNIVHAADLGGLVVHQRKLKPDLGHFSHTGTGVGWIFTRRWSATGDRNSRCWPWVVMAAPLWARERWR